MAETTSILRTMKQLLVDLSEDCVDKIKMVRFFFLRPSTFLIFVGHKKLNI